MKQILPLFSETGLYRNDNGSLAVDLAARAVFAFLLLTGYEGENKDAMAEMLEKSADYTLAALSVNGEIPFGGCRNQMLENEGWYAALCEYYLTVLPADDSRCAQFADTRNQALGFTENWLSKPYFRHVKNFYPVDSLYGTEESMKFERGMTLALLSFSVASVLSVDEDIEAKPRGTYIAETDPTVHKIFLNNGTFFAEYDVNANFKYDANGLGRVHHKEAHPSIAISAPCTVKPDFGVNLNAYYPLTICPVVEDDEGFHFGAEEGTKYEIIDKKSDGNAQLTLRSTLATGDSFKETLTLGDTEVVYQVRGNSTVMVAIPVFETDGSDFTEIDPKDYSVSVQYQGWKCTYEADGELIDGMIENCNRNGHYRLFMAAGYRKVTVRIRFEKV